MTNVSQNGYTVLERDEVRVYNISNAGVKLPLRPGNVGYVLQHFVRRFHNRIENLNVTDTFGYSKRRISGSGDWSNHASGTAVDLNSVKHAYGKVGTFNWQQLSDLRKLLDEYDDVLRWGGDYRGTKDEMHFEIDKPIAAVTRLARVLRRNNTVYLSRLKPGRRNTDIYMVKRELHKRGLHNQEPNNYFGKTLRNAYSKWQESLGYSGADADGVPGRASLEALGFKVK